MHLLVLGRATSDKFVHSNNTLTVPLRAPCLAYDVAPCLCGRLDMHSRFNSVLASQVLIDERHFGNDAKEFVGRPALKHSATLPSNDCFGPYTKQLLELSLR